MAYSTIYQGNGGAVDVWTEYSQDIAANKSTITVIAYVKKTNSSYYSYRDAPQTFTLKVNGASSTRGWTFNFSNMNLNQRYEIMRASNTFPHAANGTVGNIGYSVHCATGTDGLGTISGSGSLAISTIPRSSVPTINPTNQYLGSNIIISTNRASGSNFRHNITYSFQGLTGVISNGVLDSTTWVVPTSFSSKLTSTSSANGTIHVNTYNGTDFVGAQSVSFTATLPGGSGYDPTVSTPSISVYGSGPDASNNRYIEGITRINVSFSSSASSGANITSNLFSVKRLSDDGNLTNYTGTSGVTSILALSGRYVVTAIAKDSRGRMGSATREFTVEPYSAPNISSFSASRNGGTTVYVSSSGSFSYLGGMNSLSVAVDRRVRGGSYSRMGNYSGSSNGTFSVSANFSGNSESVSYDYKITLTDAFGKTSFSERSLSTAATALSIGRDIGIGVGKVWESGALDVSGSATFSGSGSATFNYPASFNYVTYLSANTYLNGQNIATTNMIPTPAISAFSSFSDGQQQHGLYVKFKDGTMITHIRVTNVSLALADVPGNTANKTGYTPNVIYKESFIYPPSVSASIDVGELTLGTRTTYSGSCSFRVFSPYPAYTSFTGKTLHVMAMGRWF